jgi:post-segregation antitoxin (ccd killing protein)
MGDPAAKLSITVPSKLAAEVRKRVGVRGVSSFVTRAIAHELEREQLSAYLEELDREFGPVPAEITAEARRAWRKR